jgi:hypothetical protein
MKENTSSEDEQKEKRPTTSGLVEKFKNEKILDGEFTDLIEKMSSIWSSNSDQHPDMDIYGKKEKLSYQKTPVLPPSTTKRPTASSSGKYYMVGNNLARKPHIIFQCVIGDLTLRGRFIERLISKTSTENPAPLRK